MKWILIINGKRTEHEYKKPLTAINDKRILEKVFGKNVEIKLAPKSK